ncbi:hypothetical protein JQS43_25490 [Natronosporangium hydrolyticum]|uniref:AbiEi antitoxin C-terminal domain-containing protein n=1 Tax=Natronosporangium hydrolyticum TaxID=2811111 RepID=A0A895YGW5_9ACTN|nr:type IV toxin-antitoxin system AbiEi family antitoxin [Natronosporangium hydrolyticum]QSB14759.1 hypothetical protein JQS43_25490 [Natronosporangium hydrolyticum]
MEIRAATERLDAIASHETAAMLWGIPTLGAPDHHQLTRARRTQGTARYPGVVVHHSRVAPGEHTMIRGVPVTTLPRTVVDLSRRRPFRAGVVVADAALRRRCPRDELLEVLDSCRGWPGIARARHVAAFADHRAESPLESISRVAFHHHGLPTPTLQAIIGGLERADFLWAPYRVIGEADGLTKYTAPEVLRREKLRDAGFAELGFTAFRWTWRDAYQRPDALAYRAEQMLVRGGYRP